MASADARLGCEWSGYRTFDRLANRVDEASAEPIDRSGPGLLGVVDNFALAISPVLPQQSSPRSLVTITTLHSDRQPSHA
jgi:hypothetical protein